MNKPAYQAPDFTAYTAEQWEEHRAKVRALNDDFRTGWKNYAPNVIVWTQGIAAMLNHTNPIEELLNTAELTKLVQEFSDFTEENDPHQEHDFGAFDFRNTRCFWKIDYYDSRDGDIAAGSPDPSDAQRTSRVLTIMQASEY